MKRLISLMMCVVSFGAAAQLPDYVPTEGLVAWYPLNGNAEDAYAGQLDGTPSNPQPSVNRNLEDSSAYFFDGLDDRVTLSNFQETSFGLTHFSVNAWVLLNEAKRHWIFSNYKTVNGSTIVLALGADVADGQAVLHVDLRHPNGAPEIFGSQVIELHEWHMVSLVRNGWNVSLFLDGELDAVADISIESNNLRNGHPFHFGMENGNGQFWHGSLDDIGLWDRALSPAEIWNLYSAGSPSVGCMEVEACNYNPEAIFDDGSCLDCALFAERCGPGTIWDSEMQMCIGDGTGDINLDGCVQLNDLLDLLSAYGDCGAEESPWQCGDPLEYQGYDYETVQIGEQCWFAENLRAENYSNGDVIPSDLDNAAWSSTDEGAKTYYNVDSARLETFGMLYNFYAAQDSRSLCPAGWHVPSDSEWSELTTALGGAEVAGNAMKMTVGWGDSDSGTNTSGFGGLPGGNRGAQGEFSGGDLYGDWWTTDLTASTAWLRNLYRNRASVDRYPAATLRGGLSIRCIKDIE